MESWEKVSLYRLFEFASATVYGRARVFVQIPPLKLPSLTVLNLEDNRIGAIAGLEQCPKLETLTVPGGKGDHDHKSGQHGQLGEDRCV